MRTTGVALMTCCVPLALVMVASLGPVANAQGEVTRLEVRWTSSPPGKPPHLRALVGPSAATAGCWPPAGSSFGPCQSAPQTRWVEGNPNAEGVPQTISFVDESADQERDFEFEVTMPCVPPCGEVTYNATIRHADGSTSQVGPIVLGRYECDAKGCGWVFGKSIGKSLGGAGASSLLSAEAVRGKVFVTCPEDAGRERLTDAVRLGAGCRVNARAGKVRLTSARPGTNGLRSAVVSQGIFKPTRKASGLTELRLAGSRLCARMSRRGRTQTTATNRGRRLLVRTAGRLSVRGRSSSATAAAATWLVEDRCDGSTLTRVRSGSVSVRDFRTDKTVKLRAGKSHKTRPR